jgi:integrase
MESEEMTMAGSIQKLTGPHGVAYLVRVELPRDPVTGKRRQQSKSFKTKKAAEVRLAAWLTEVERGTAVDTSKMTVSDLFAQWMEVLRGTNPKERTIVEYERTIKTHILPSLGATLAQKVTPATIDAFNILLRNKGCSDAMVHRCHKRLRQAFDYALKRRIVAVNPMLAIDPPTVRSRPAVVLTGPQIGRFLAYAASDAYSPLWLVLVQSGMRRGEVLALRWQDVDLAGGHARVRQCVEEINGKVHLTTPKTPAALRTITLFPESVAALKTHRDRQTFRRQTAGDQSKDMDFVFASEKGGPLTPSNVLRNLYAITKKANVEAEGDGDRLPRFHLHDLRHTHATHLLMEGWDVARVARRMGHANPAITLKLYAHAITDIQGDRIVTPAAFAFAGTG